MDLLDDPEPRVAFHVLNVFEILLALPPELSSCTEIRAQFDKGLCKKLAKDSKIMQAGFSFDNQYLEISLSLNVFLPWCSYISSHEPSNCQVQEFTRYIN